MSSFLPKERVSNNYHATKIVEYTYTNYDLTKVAADLAVITDELSRAQIALDQINNQVLIEINI